MNKLFEALEICLNEIEQGVDVDTVLFRYPEIAAELRPILEASVKAKAMAVPVPSQEVVRRNRAKLLQHASEMRERKAVPLSRRVWSVPLRRALISLTVIATLFASSTGLVRASSNTLPGDNLYPVKRTWEDVLVFFTFDANEREALELEHENERLDELHILFAEGRSVEVDFAGYVTRQNVDQWRVSGITVSISPETRLPDEQITVGAAVHVHGQSLNGDVAATRIELLPSDSKLPEVEDKELEFEEEKPEDAQKQIEENTGTGSENEAQISLTPATSGPEHDPEDVTIEGAVSSFENNFVVVNGIVMDVRHAEVKGTPQVGAVVKVEGYYDASGVFIAVKIEYMVIDSNNETDSTSIDTKDDSNENAMDNDNTDDDDHFDNNNDD